MVEALRAMDGGVSASVICEQWQIALSTLYEWRDLYRGMSVDAVSQLECLRRENAELKHRLSRYERDCDVLMAALQHQNLAVHERCVLVKWLIRHHGISVSRACRLVGISRTLFLSRSSPQERSGRMG